MASRFVADLEAIGRRRAADALQQLESDLASGRKTAGRPLNEYREKAEKRLIDFVKLMWPVLEASPFVNGRALEVMAEHYEAVSNGQIKRLLINVPPGCCKSLLSNVFWPAWEWGPKRRPWRRILSISYSDDNPLRDNLKFRELIRSEQYRQLWGETFKLRKTDEKWLINDRTGFKQVGHVGGATGQRADLVMIDDPHQIAEAESDLIRETANRWFLETGTLRVTNLNAAFVVIMQRLHDHDMSGVILSKELGFEHLCLPMRYEEGVSRKPTVIGFSDWRTKEGELLWPERFPDDYLKNDVEKRLSALGGEYAIASQLQQRPVPREGGDFKCDRLDYVDAAPPGLIVARGWDLAGTKGKTSAWTVGVKMGMTRGANPRFYVLDVVRCREESHVVEQTMRSTTVLDGHAVIQDFPQDPGQAGKSQVTSITSLLAGYQAFASPETGDKRLRAKLFATQVGGGNVSLVRGNWNDAYVDELRRFPAGTWKDQVDASSRAFARLLLLKNSGSKDVPPVMFKGFKGPD